MSVLFELGWNHATHIDATHIDATHIDATHIDATHIDSSRSGSCVFLGSQVGSTKRSSAQDIQQLPLDMSKMDTSYSNFVRVTSTPEEMLIDFGINVQSDQAQKTPLQVSQRVVMNYYSAKRMVTAVRVAVERHEKAFGEIETDVRKRMRGAIQ
jgi:hypothetical protein